MTVTDDDDEDGKDACTFYEVIERFRGYTFVPRAAADRADAPDPRPPGERRLSGAGRQGLQRPRQLRLSDLVPGLPAEQRRGADAAAGAARPPAPLLPPAPQGSHLGEAPLPPEFQRTLDAMRKYRALK